MDYYTTATPGGNTRASNIVWSDELVEWVRDDQGSGMVSWRRLAETNSGGAQDNDQNFSSRPEATKRRFGACRRASDQRQLLLPVDDNYFCT